MAELYDSQAGSYTLVVAAPSRSDGTLEVILLVAFLVIVVAILRSIR